MVVAADYVDRCPRVDRTLPTSTLCTGIPSIQLLNALTQNSIMATLTSTDFFQICIGFCLEKLILLLLFDPFFIRFSFFLHKPHYTPNFS